MSIRHWLYPIAAVLFLIQGDAAAHSVLPGECKGSTQRTYNITASDDSRFVWFRNAKVGTRSILHILRSRTKLSVDGYGIPYSAARYAGYFKFAFVRNPWDRVVSAYFSKVANRKHKAFKECFGKSFDYFVDYINRQDLKRSDAHIMLQIELAPMRQLDCIGRFENFEDDLRAILWSIGIEAAEIPHRNTSSHEHYSVYFTERTRSIIAKKYKADIDAFGYTFEEL